MISEKNQIVTNPKTITNGKPLFATLNLNIVKTKQVPFRSHSRNKIYQIRLLNILKYGEFVHPRPPHRGKQAIKDLFIILEIMTYSYYIHNTKERIRQKDLSTPR